MTELNKAEQFQLEEYKSLRKEIELYLTECRSQERYTLIAIGAIWAWLMINHVMNGFLWFVPVLLTLATSIRMAAILQHFVHIGEYICELEDKFGAPGWEHKEKGWTLGGAYVILDILLLFLAVWGWHHRDILGSLRCAICH